MQGFVGKKVLVTGAGGFIGSHLVEQLVKIGANVRAFIRYNSKNSWGSIEHLPKDIKSNIEVVLGDLRDPESVRRAVKGTSVIFHLGASIAVQYSFINPRDFIETNVVGTLNVLNAAKEYNIERIVHTSSSEVYGTAIYVPIDEKHPLQAQSPYSASKIAADKLAESFYLSYGLPVATLRPFNTFGPRQSARAVISTIILQLLNSEKVRIGSTTPVRDFTFVEDTVNGFIKIGEKEDAVGQVINIGTGYGVSVGELINKIASIIGKEPELEVEPERVRPNKSEVEVLIADYSKAKQVLDWEPKVTFDDGLNRTIDWFRNFHNHYKADIYNV